MFWICGNDRAAFVAYQVLLAKGVRIPQDVAVMGFDNLGWRRASVFTAASPQFSFHMTFIGREAALPIIEGREGGRVTRIPCPRVDPLFPPDIMLTHSQSAPCCSTSHSVGRHKKRPVPVLLAADRFDYSSPLPVVNKYFHG